MSAKKLVTFNPRAVRNLQAVDEILNMAGVTDMKVLDLLGEGNPQIYVTCGRGALSTLRVMRHGMAVIEMAVSPMPDAPTGVWTLRGSAEDPFDHFLIVTFEGATLVFAIGEKVTEVQNSGFDGGQSSLLVGMLEDGSWIQVTATGIIHIKPDRRRNRWETSNRGRIVHAAANERQAVIALEGGELTYFELDAGGRLIEVETRLNDSEVLCLDIGPIPEGRQRSRFLAVGCHDKTVKVLSLDPETCLSKISV